METGYNRLLIDCNMREIIERLFFIDQKYIEFWISNPIFLDEYRSIAATGEKDGFYLFYLAARNAMASMGEMKSSGIDVGFDLGFAHKSIEEMERRIAVGYDDRASDPKLNFILNRVAAPAISMRYWLMVPEFIDAMHKLIPSGIAINNQTVYQVMTRIYKQKEDEREQSAIRGERLPFNFNMARKAIKSVEKRLKIPEEDRLKTKSSPLVNGHP